MTASNQSVPTWARAHEELSRLARTRAALDWEEGGWLLCAAREQTHRHLGFGSLVEYVERLFGYKPRTTKEKLRVAEALEGLPELAEELRAGALSWSTARELTRVATARNERAWIDAARGKTLREVEQLVAGRGHGDTPDTPARDEARRHTLAFDVGADTLALFREAMAKLCREAGEALDDDTALLLMARHVLGGPTDDGRASYQIALNRCEECGRTTQLGKGEAIPVEREVAEMAACDAQHLGAGKRATQDVPPATRRHVLRRDGHRCVVPGCKNAIFVDLHHLDRRAEGGGHDADGLVVLCGAHHRAEHRGQLIIEGRVSTGLRFRHADGTPYGRIDAPLAADTHTRAFSALRNLGFRETEARRALSEARGDTLEPLLRSALRVLSAGVCSRGHEVYGRGAREARREAGRLDRDREVASGPTEDQGRARGAMVSAGGEAGGAQARANGPGRRV